MRIGVITFPGSLDDRDAARAVRLAGAEPVPLWHADRDLRLRVENTRTAWTGANRGGEQIVVPLKSGEGAYAADPGTLAELGACGRVVRRYADPNPNGSAGGIAGVCNTEGNVVGLMPHPEHAVDTLTGPSADGLGFFTSVVAGVLA